MNKPSRERNKDVAALGGEGKTHGEKERRREKKKKD